MPSPLFTDPSDVDSPHSRASIRTSEKRPNQVQPRSQVGNRYAMSRTLNIVRGPWIWWTRSYRQGASNMPPSLDSSPLSGLQFAFLARWKQNDSKTKANPSPSFR